MPPNGGLPSESPPTQYSNLCAWGSQGPQSASGSTVPRRQNKVTLHIIDNDAYLSCPNLSWSHLMTKLRPIIPWPRLMMKKKTHVKLSMAPYVRDSKLSSTILTTTNHSVANHISAHLMTRRRPKYHLSWIFLTTVNLTKVKFIMATSLSWPPRMKKPWVSSPMATPNDGPNLL